MSKLIIGSICLTDLGEQVTKKHSAISVGKNGKRYASVAIWVNDEADKLGNNVSIQLNSQKDMREKEGKVYVGNGRDLEKGANKATPANEYSDDLPF